MSVIEFDVTERVVEAVMGVFAGGLVGLCPGMW